MSAKTFFWCPLLASSRRNSFSSVAVSSFSCLLEDVTESLAVINKNPVVTFNLQYKTWKWCDGGDTAVLVKDSVLM